MHGASRRKGCHREEKADQKETGQGSQFSTNYMYGGNDVKR